jgi:hypothetical protein
MADTEDSTDAVVKVTEAPPSAQTVRSLPPVPTSETDTGLAPVVEKPGQRRWVGPAIVLVLAGLATGAILFRLAQPPALEPVDVFLTSEPPGASVVLDGRPQSGLTPIVLYGVETDRPHTLKVEALGYGQWHRRMTFVPGEANKLHATLEPEAP